MHSMPSLLCKPCEMSHSPSFMSPRVAIGIEPICTFGVGQIRQLWSAPAAQVIDSAPPTGGSWGSIARAGLPGSGVTVVSQALQRPVVG